MMIEDVQRLIKRILPHNARYALRQTVNSFKTTETVFTEIYQKGMWGKRDALYSGTGSRGSAADQYVSAIQQFIDANRISSVVDLGCGDFQIGMRIAESCERYTGVDVVKFVVDENTRRHGSDTVSFRHVNIVEDELPDADLCLIRQVLQHLSNAQIKRILAKLAKYRAVIITEHYPSDAEFKAPNLDKVHGPGTRVTFGSAVCLDQPPFEVRSLNLLLDVPGAAAGSPAEANDPHARGRIRTYLVKV